ncbi:FAD-dependent monooxygenase [Nocardia sp. CA2R105]|uniref:FAD-dependent monooxygenase n=1 Tax=Nocardia coffeae TaxID=2873381 RepID=UPI001CA6D580|nr:FAD-dependent monooxygenase [Nocardia coffeae]MBY8863409.1 FAD-dependent monooxygenase [Nocardia coffeae]
MVGNQAPVVIVGAGPVGMVLALELAHHEIDSVLVEAHAETTKFPKMDETNPRSMELLARLGLTDDLRAAGVPPEFSFDTVFCSSLEGFEYARWSEPSVAQMCERIDRATDGTLPGQPWQRISQEYAEDVLMRRCLQNPRVDVLRPWRVTDVAEHDDEVTVTAVHAETGEARTLSAGYVVGCDGARSRVRTCLGIEQDGMERILTLALVHFRSRDRERLQAHGQFWHLYFASGGILIAQDEEETWTLHGLVPPDTELGNIDPVEFIHRVCGAPVEVDEILAQSIWQPNVLLADHYRKGRIFLAGDACHQVIPNGGYGMNTGIGDAVDLGWKFAAVLHGWGGDALLDSYEAERRPVAERNRDWSFRHVGAQLEIQSEVDLELIGADTEEGGRHRHEMAAFIAERRGEACSPGVEYGYRYEGSPAVVSEAGEGPALDPMRYEPTTRPGARAPHVVLPDGRSILSLYSRGFTLVDHGGIGGEKFAAAAWAAGIPFEHVVIEASAGSASVYERALVLVRPDGHVAWRGESVDDDPAAILATVTGHVIVPAAVPQEEATR